jgi:hypothetical protein
MIEYTAVPLEWKRLHPGKFQADGEGHRYLVQRTADGWELVVYRKERSGVRYVERGAGDDRTMCMQCAELYEGAKRARRAGRR